MSDECDHLVLSIQQNIIYSQSMKIRVMGKTLKNHTRGTGIVPHYQINHLHISLKISGFWILLFGFELNWMVLGKCVSCN